MTRLFGFLCVTLVIGVFAALLAYQMLPYGSQADALRVDLTTALTPEGSLPELTPAISAEETKALSESFDWRNFPRLPERDSEGRPNLYYAGVYISERWQRDYLDEIGIHYSFLPLFGEERRQWRGKSGFFSLRGDGHGVFAFTVVPAIFLNTLKGAAESGERTFEAVVLRDIPIADARADDGALSYEYLRANGFQYGGIEQRYARVDQRNDVLGGFIATAYAFTPSRVLRMAVSPLEDAVDEARVFTGEWDRIAAGSAKITVRVLPINTDPAFAPGAPIVRSWGNDTDGADPSRPTLGEPLWLRNMTVQSHKGISLFRGNAGDEGEAVFDVAKGEQNLCVELANNAAEITNFLTAIVLCNFNGPDPVTMRTDSNLDIQNDQTIIMMVQDYRVNIFAQMQDGYDYVTQVIGRSPRQVRVMTGVQADLIGEVNGGRAFAPCLANMANLNTLFIDPLIGLLAADVDIVMPFDQGESANSRGVPVHEYGHFVLCDLMHHTNAWKFQEQWLNILGNLGNEHPTSQINYANEAFADFIALQILGGANYPTLNGATRASGMAYCPTSGPDVRRCAEDNVGGAGELYNPPDGVLAGVRLDGTPNTNDEYLYNVARMVTLMHDAFDGASQFTRSVDYPPNPGAAVPTASLAPTIFGPPVRVATDVDDEEIALPGSAVQHFIRKLFDHASTLDERNWNNALARTMLTYGYTREQVCRFFVLHAGGFGVGGSATTLGIPSYVTCNDMVDEDALATNGLPPARPATLTVTRDPGQPRTVTSHWTDLSPAATGFEYRLERAGFAPRTMRLPYARVTARTENDLIPDHRYTAVVSTFNRELSRSTSAGFVTYAEPPISVTASPEVGNARIEWTTSSIATRYAVWMLLPERRELFTTTDVSATVRGLTSGVDYTFGVAALNQADEATEIVAATPVRVTAEVVAFVAPGGADEIGVEEGSQSRPYRSLSYALSRADERGVSMIRMREGEYVESHMVDIDRSVLIVGGHRGDAWRSGGITEIRLTAGEAGDAPDTSLFETRGFAASAGLRVQRGADVVIDGVDFTIDAVGIDETCVAAIYSSGVITLVESSASVTPQSAAAGSCFAALIANGGSVRMSDSALTGVVTIDLDANVSRIQATGLLAGRADILIAGSDLSGVKDLSGRLIDYSRIAGLTGDALRGFRVSRSTFRTAEAIDWTNNNGEYAGASISLAGPARIDDSLFWSAKRGHRGFGLDIQSSNSQQPVTLVHITAIVGDDWNLTEETASEYVGAAVRLSGKISEFVLVNSILSYAGGGRMAARDEPPARWSGLDLSATGVGLGVDPINHVTARGNAFSVPVNSQNFSALLQNAVRNMTYCGNEFRDSVNAIDINIVEVYNCSGVVGAAASWDVGDNRAMTYAPFFTSSESTLPLIRFATAFTRAGAPAKAYPTLNDSYNTIKDGGVNIVDIPRSLSAPRDRGGRDRDDANVDGAGAWMFTIVAFETDRDFTPEPRRDYNFEWPWR